MKIADSCTEIDVTLASENVPAPAQAVAHHPLPAVGVKVDGEALPLRTLAPGDIVADRYRLGPIIGAGGMGIVYKAQHLGLGTWVAIKVIRPDIAQSSSIWRRFSREARALAALHNKHVVRVHDAGTLPSGLRYLVMELLEGTDLRRLIQKEGALPPDRAVDYALQVCSALGDAHRLHIIHRDVKPENIFLAHYRACEPTIKLLDFGVALFQDDAGQLTVPGRGVGSPHYLSPEQMQNPSGVDQRSDIWAVGLLIFELLAGRSPFRGLNAAHICLKISKGDMPALADVCPTLPAELCAIVQNCLALDPAQRFQSIDDLSAALEPFSGRHRVALCLHASELASATHAVGEASEPKNADAKPGWASMGPS